MAGRKSRITIHDIAQELNVTASTVSRALQDHPRIGAETKAAVLKLAKKYNYSRNTLASGLRTGKRNTIGVIVPRINRHFFSNVIGGIEHYVSGRGYRVIIMQSLEKQAAEANALRAMMDAQVDGLIISVSVETRDAHHFAPLVEQQLPLVMFDRVLEGVSASKVLLNDFAGAFAAVEHLVAQKCRRIAHLGGPGHINVYNDRLRGYTEAIGAAKLQLEPELILHNSLTEEAGYAAMARLFKKGKKPDAVFAASDYSALGALLWLKEHGVDVPGQVRIIGFSNEPFTAFTAPALSTVAQPGDRMGQMAAERLLQQIEHPGNQEYLTTEVLNTQIIIRESTIKSK